MLRIENLSIAINDKVILHDINLHIPKGEVHVLYGPNGTGKSTLIGAIMGFERYKITQGKIYFKGQDITEMPLHERAKLGIGVMIQRPPTIRGLSLRQMVQICGATPEEAEIMAEWMGLSEHLDRSVNDGFSGGEIKRSELLQLMAQKPELLLLDEPESGVDVENIALVGRAARYILSGKSCQCEKGCCPHFGGNLPGKVNPLEESQNSGLVITHLGHILKYIPATKAHILFDGTLSCSGDPMEMFSCICQKGYEHCINKGCGGGL